MESICTRSAVPLCPGAFVAIPHTTFLKWIILGVSLLLGSWFAFDGVRALVLGNYITPRSGPYAGQLGPWSRVVKAVGLEPRSPFVKGVHVALGVGWLISTIVLAFWPEVGKWSILGCAVASLWYAPLGTVLSGVALVALFFQWRGQR